MGEKLGPYRPIAAMERKYTVGSVIARTQPGTSIIYLPLTVRTYNTRSLFSWEHGTDLTKLFIADVDA